MDLHVSFIVITVTPTLTLKPDFININSTNVLRKDIKLIISLLFNFKHFFFKLRKNLKNTKAF